MILEEFIEHLKLNKHLYYEEEFERIIGFLEELKITRKALEIACKENGWSNCEYYLQKVREE